MPALGSLIARSYLPQNLFTSVCKYGGGVPGRTCHSRVSSMVGRALSLLSKLAKCAVSGQVFPSFCRFLLPSPTIGSLLCWIQCVSECLKLPGGAYPHNLQLLCNYACTVCTHKQCTAHTTNSCIAKPMYNFLSLLPQCLHMSFTMQKVNTPPQRMSGMLVLLSSVPLY